jgi:hypothetical protein
VAGSLEEALLKAGVVGKDETPRARREREQTAEREREQAELDAKLADERPLPAFDPPALHHAARGNEGAPVGDTAPPEPDEEKVRGQMIWLHKSVPVLEIEGKPPISPDEIAAGRRR